MQFHNENAILTVKVPSRQSEGREWGRWLDPSWLDLAFLGRPDFPSKGPKTL